MKKFFIPALLLAGAFCANAEQTVLFSEDFKWIEPWCDAAGITVNHFEENSLASTPRTDAHYIIDEDFGGTTGRFWLRNALQNTPENGGKGYWCHAYDANGATENVVMGATSTYFGRYFLKFGKTNVQANFRFTPLLNKEITKADGEPCTLTFDWAPWISEDWEGLPADEVTLDVIIQQGDGMKETVDQVTHSKAPGGPLEWFTAEIDLTDFEISPITRIYIQPCEEVWQKANSGRHRWCLTNIVLTAGEEDEPVVAGDVYFEQNFNKMLEPWVEALSLTDPVGTDTTGDLGVSIQEDSRLGEGGRNIFETLLDASLVNAAIRDQYGTENGFLTLIWDGYYHAKYYTIRAHKGYFRLGCDGVSVGLQLPKVAIPDDADDLYLEFDWCPVKNANGEYAPTVLSIELEGAGVLVDDITHNMQKGDPYAWKHECIGLFDAGATPGPAVRFYIEPSATAGQQVPGDNDWYIDNIRIASAPTTGVTDIVVEDNSNAPVEYFNLQGVRIANPENGLYIRRQGNKVSKIIL